MSDRENTQKLITIYNRRLQKLSETQALYCFNTPTTGDIEMQNI